VRTTILALTILLGATAFGAAPAPPPSAPDDAAPPPPTVPDPHSTAAVPAESPIPEPAPEDPFTPLNDDERRTLLKVAWQILSAHLREQPIRDTDLPASEFTPRLLRPRGCFVALKKNGQLRGMQGEIEASRPLLRQVAVFTRKAATRDPRFEPLNDLDLSSLVVEISVIGPRRLIAGPDELRLDLDGIYLEKWGRRALFLPGIGSAQGWTVTRTLDELCRQAALPVGGWSQSAKLQAFTTELIAGGEPAAPPKTQEATPPSAGDASPAPAPSPPPTP